MTQPEIPAREEATPGLDRDPAALASAERAVLEERARAAMQSGVRIRDPRAIAIRGQLECGPDVEIDLHVIIEGVVTIGAGTRIGPNCMLINSRIGSGCVVHPYSMIENAVVGENVRVGPYARIRPDTVLHDSVQIGNFVEIKNSDVGAHSRINHLTFIGDATLGEGVTIGAGTITCNHNRAGTVRTVIEAGAYVGSGTELVAPVTIGANATIGAGSTISHDAPPGMLTLGRSRQKTVPGWKPPDGS